MVKITGVEPGSYAADAKIAAGDQLISINGNQICDVLDYRFYLAENKVALVCMRDGQRYALTIEKGEYEDIGLDFESSLMDKKRTCDNKCIFCFIDQLPHGMRKTLYFKDDDSRLSFLHGNYITLTNLEDGDIDRIIKMKISPLRVSIHTTNPQLRVKMMNNRRAGEVLSYLRRVADAHIAIDAQIVLCRGINDKEELERTMSDILQYYPALHSVSVVPAGLTRHRDGLYPLSSYTPEECLAIIKQVQAHGDRCKKQFGSRIFFSADELYIKAGMPLPKSEYYEDYSQMENGVGLISSFEDEFLYELQNAQLPVKSDRKISIATGAAAYPTISKLAARLCEAVTGLKINVYEITNNFFGAEVTVAGLLTGGDIAEQLAVCELGDELLVPQTALRSGDDVFLDDITLGELSLRLGVRTVTSGNGGAEALRAMLGI